MNLIDEDMLFDEKDIRDGESNNIAHDPNKTLLEYSEQLETYLDKFNIKKYDISQFSDYETIGRGGTAIVYKATLKGKKYALKNLNCNLSMNYNSFKKARREFKLLYEIDNPNIVKFYGILR
ncbi:3763_t:CDS:2, partial [Cetraspora pellucida]